MACSDQSTTLSKASARGAVRTRKAGMSTLLFDLCEDEVFTSTTLEAAGWDEHVLTDSEFESLGPAVVDIVAHAEGSNFSSNLKYDVIIQYKGWNGGWVDGSTALIAPRTSAAYVIGSVITDRAQLGRRIRIVLRTTVATGSSATQKGNFNITVAVRLYTGC